MLNKTISVKLVQDDIDWLEKRADECLAKIKGDDSIEEKVRLLGLYRQYNELYLANFNNVKEKKDE